MKTRLIAILLSAFVLTLASCEDKGGLGDGKNKPPVVPSSPYPANYASNVPVNFTFTWTCSDPDEDVLTYDIFISGDSNFSTYIYQTGLSSPAQGVTNLSYGATYYWIIRAYDAEDTTYSPRWRFTTTFGSPSMSVTPADLDFGTTTTTMQFRISNTGTGNLGWSVTDDRTWMSLSPTNGVSITDTDTITVTVNRGSLSAGTYTGSITVTPSVGSVQTINVTMKIPTKANLVPDYTQTTVNYNQTTDVLSGLLYIKNTGETDATGPRVDYYASTNNIISTSDYKILQGNTFNVTAGTTVSRSYTINMPYTSVPYGTYYFGFILDPADVVDESNESDNIGVSNAAVIVYYAKEGIKINSGFMQTTGKE